MSITSQIWRFASGKLAGKSVNLSKVSKILNVRVATLWTYHHGRARWTADLWLKALILIGGAKIQDESLIIPITNDLRDILETIPGEDVYRTKKGPTKLERELDAC